MSKPQSSIQISVSKHKVKMECGSNAFYTDGRLAPCWGYQIDETASIVYGVYEHYKMTKDKSFLEETYEMCQRAIVQLGTFPFGVSGTNGVSGTLGNFALKNITNENSDFL